MEDKLVTIARFATPDAAEMARMALGEAGIDSRLGGAATAGWLWHYGTALGGVQLLVRSEDVQQAERVLQEPLGHEEDLVDELDSESEDDDACSAPEGADALASRAWKAAVLGLLFCPPLLAFYSIWLLLDKRLWTQEEDHPRDWRPKAAVAVNVVTLSWILFLAWMFAPGFNQSYYPPPPPIHTQEQVPGQPSPDETPPLILKEE